MHEKLSVATFCRKPADADLLMEMLQETEGVGEILWETFKVEHRAATAKDFREMLGVDDADEESAAGVFLTRATVMAERLF